MPRYQIQAPDGRTVTIEGDSAPTQADAEEIFAKLPPKESPAPQAGQSGSYDGSELKSNNPSIKDSIIQAYRKVRSSEPVMAIAGPPDNLPNGVIYDPQSHNAQFVNGAIRSAPPAIGATIGSIGGPAGAAAGGALGGSIGEYLAEKKERANMRPGSIVGAGIVGAVPGSSMAGTGAKGLATQAGKYIASNLVGKATEVGMDEHRLMNKDEVAGAVASGVAGAVAGKLLDAGANSMTAKTGIAKAEGAPLRQTIKDGRDLGFVIPPSLARASGGKGLVNDTLNSIGGKAATAQAAVEINQPLVNKAVREELGLAPGKALSPAELELLKQPKNKVYEEAAAVSDKAKVALEQFKSASADSKALFAQNRQNYHPDTLTAAREKAAEAEDYWNLLRKELDDAGKSDLAKKLSEARTDLAKISVAQRALKVGSGDIDPKVLGDAFADGEKLTGNLLKIGRFQNTFASAMKAQAASPPSGVHQLLPLIGGGLGAAVGAKEGVQAGMAAAAVPVLAPRGARSMVLSAPYQQMMANPNYGGTRPDLAALIARYGAQVPNRSDKMAEDEPPSSVPQYLRRR